MYMYILGPDPRLQVCAAPASRPTLLQTPGDTILTIKGVTRTVRAPEEEGLHV